MPKAPTDIDPVLITRCAGILHQRAKDGSGPVDSLSMGYLLGVTPDEALKAMQAIHDVIIDRSMVHGRLDKFSVRP